MGPLGAGNFSSRASSLSSTLAFCFISCAIPSDIGFSMPSLGENGGSSSVPEISSARFDVVGEGDAASRSTLEVISRARWSAVRKMSETEFLRIFLSFAKPSVGCSEMALSILTLLGLRLSVEFPAWCRL